ncbi:MAG: sugar phosphate isomerase/epimerase [Planctomycetes bacterium]|nr:sugar phosphate isomerase/epimerase [Planctomycetota bacterium]MCC7396863.1 sugar phosphate isomerase/epimerase [Planctomycetota bacterium]
MRLGYQSNGLQNHRLGDALALLAEHGYRAVGLTPDTCHLDPATTSAGQLADLARQLADLGLEPVMETGARFLLDARVKHEPTLMTPGPARQRRLDYTSRTAAMGARLGARVVSFWTGIDRQPGSDSRLRMLDGVRESCRRIRAEGLEPSLEPEPGMFVETVADWHLVRDELGDEAPGLTLDIGHLYAVWEGEPAHVIGAVAPFLCQVHLEDMRRGQHEHLEPGAGDVDFAAALTALKNAGYSGPVCFELSRSSHRAPAAVAACGELWRRCVGDPRR